jgi:hypothetical protein
LRKAGAVIPAIASGRGKAGAMELRCAAVWELGVDFSVDFGVPGCARLDGGCGGCCGGNRRWW